MSRGTPASKSEILSGFKGLGYPIHFSHDFTTLFFLFFFFFLYGVRQGCEILKNVANKKIFKNFIFFFCLFCFLFVCFFFFYFAMLIIKVMYDLSRKTVAKNDSIPTRWKSIFMTKTSVWQSIFVIFLCKQIFLVFVTVAVLHVCKARTLPKPYTTPKALTTCQKMSTRWEALIWQWSHYGNAFFYVYM